MYAYVYDANNWVDVFGLRKEWRYKQAELISQGKFAEAMEMDIDETISKYGKKYDEHINEMIDYTYNKAILMITEEKNLKKK